MIDEVMNQNSNNSNNNTHFLEVVRRFILTVGDSMASMTTLTQMKFSICFSDKVLHSNNLEDNNNIDNIKVKEYKEINLVLLLYYRFFSYYFLVYSQVYFKNPLNMKCRKVGVIQ